MASTAATASTSAATAAAGETASGKTLASHVFIDNKTLCPKKATTPWVEKYRPRTVSDVEYQDEVVAVLKKTIQGNDFSHMLFFGPPGTGKTSCILAAARDLFGPELRSQRVLELNASDERGIKVIREKVKHFAQLSANVVVKGYPCPPFKIVILDEADSMTSDAQSALRRTMETYSKVTRFCLVCNYVSRIIEPLASRCAKFRFKPLSHETLRHRIDLICEKEHVNISEETKQTLLDVSGGDLRKAITYLQSAQRLYGDGAGINAADVVDLSGTVPDDVVTDLLTHCEGGVFDSMQECVRDVFRSGYSATLLTKQLFNVVVSTERFSDDQKTAIAEKLADVNKNLVEGSDEYLQLLDLSSHIRSVIRKRSI